MVSKRKIIIEVKIGKKKVITGSKNLRKFSCKFLRVNSTLDLFLVHHKAKLSFTKKHTHMKSFKNFLHSYCERAKLLLLFIIISVL